MNTTDANTKKVTDRAIMNVEKAAEKAAEKAVKTAAIEVMKAMKRAEREAKKAAKKADKQAEKARIVAEKKAMDIAEHEAILFNIMLSKTPEAKAKIAERIGKLSAKLKTIQPRFSDVINGYHLLHDLPISGHGWEELNCDIVSEVCVISCQAMGNHISGKDNRFDDVNISNKTSKTEYNKVDTGISSYRLTSVCNNNSIGCESEILNEIEKRDLSFDCYSILNCSPHGDTLYYKWYIIPKSFYVFKIEKLVHKNGSRGKHKGHVVGWKWDHGDIRFSMSSQLWFKIENIKELDEFMVCSTEINIGRPKLSYADIYKSHCNAIQPVIA